MIEALSPVALMWYTKVQFVSNRVVCGAGRRLYEGWDMADKRIVLASSSPRRRELLGRLVSGFETEPARCAEDAQGSPARVALQQGYDKALDVYGRNRDALVIGADTLVALDGRILGKPCDAADARAMLHALSGRAHSVFTGMCVVSAQGCAVRLDETRVRFRELTDELIDAYVSTGEPLDKAGAYGIQSLGGALVMDVRGDLDSAIGLNARGLAELLEQFGVAVRPYAGSDWARYARYWASACGLACG